MKKSPGILGFALCLASLAVIGAKAAAEEDCLAKAVAKQAESAQARNLSVEDSIDLGEGVILKLVYIPDGEFKMGSCDKVAFARSDERPEHKVKIARPFYMGKFEVTQDQFWQVCRSLPSMQDLPCGPADRVTWNEANEFCKIVSKMSGRRLRLPTEAEWEYACRCGSGAQFPYGTNQVEQRRLFEFAWFYNTEVRELHEAGLKRPNAWGLNDMLGNAWEWCSDWYAADYYASSPAEDPKGPESGKLRVARGGPWDYTFTSCRAAFREKANPELRLNSFGFRVVAEAR
ncbi:MAG TPA: SUMF1/EgtB/PvdO family nonheme iron enzyme [Candidatus Brocadiia bacterium]|nr:SUMF1/EgtB/PvdO family nonheme iron enzyme [Candidatus Brocadiia bacterium]